MKTIINVYLLRALLVSIGLGLAGSTTLAETKTIAVAPPNPASELTPELLEIGRWFDQVVLQLANSKTPWIRVAAAIELSKSSDPGKSNDPERVAMSRSVFNEVAALPILDALTLWRMAQYCIMQKTAEACADGSVFMRLVKVDPTNLAVLLFASQNVDNALLISADSQPDQQQELLALFAKSDHFDQYWGRGSAELFAKIEDISTSLPPPPVSTEWDKIVVSPSFLLTTNLTGGWIGPGYNRLMELCSSQVESGQANAAEQCLAISRVMQDDTKTIIGRKIGFALERQVLRHFEPDSEQAMYLARQSTIYSRAFMCASPGWLLMSKVQADQTILLAWEKAYLQDLDSLGEFQAVLRAGEREYALYPERFQQSPAQCQEMLALNSAQMAEILGEQDPVLHW